ncbi:rho GTPase-activating protein 11A-like isoform X2 [Heptranchias perlo]|uniref:rho GTPase-activating protein 11A-like isoform X2 n=1 Tax=Heptranchias perlo TaxID=212740 RepID=UPI00355A0F5F
MKPDRNLLRLAVVQQLRCYGIKLKHWNKANGNNRALGRDHGRDKKIIYNAVFGTPLHALPQCTVLEHATVPQFLVDVCDYLEKHIHTEGLFRKSGSVIRLKALKAKVDRGEKCITVAPPCDVAGLVKLFFRELPEPVLPMELHEAFFRAQQLQNDERTSATILLSYLLPEKTADTLHYFLNFLKNVSLRSEDNKMDASNLAVVFAPNLFHSGDGSEKITLLTEKRLHLQAAVVHTLIDNFEDIGRVPDFVLEKIPAMLGVCVESSTPSLENLEDGDGSTMGEGKRRKRWSVGDIVSGALSKLKANRTPSATPQPDTSGTSSGTPIIMTPTWKRKIQVDSSQSLGFSNKKRRSLRHNIALELLPSGFLSQNSTPSSDGVKKADGSPQVSLESLQGPLSLSAGSVTFQSTASANRRKSKRLENQRVERVESGKPGCFSPKLNRKEMVRKSLRSRFSLGKTRDPNTLSSGGPAPNGSENIGWRLANQRDVHSYNWFSAEDLPFNPVVRHKDAKGSKCISKSEENLLTPVCNKDTHRMSWNGASPTESQVVCGHADMGTPLECYLNSRSYQSEPALVIGKPPTIPGDLQSQSVAQKSDSRKSRDSLGEDANTVTGETVLKIKNAFSESGSDLCSLIGDHRPSTVNDLGKGDLLFLQTQNLATPQKPDKPFEDPSDQKWSCFELPSQQVTEIKLQNAKIDPCSTGVSKTLGIGNNLNCIRNLDQQDINGLAVLQDKNMSFPPSVEDHSNLNKKQTTPFKYVTVFTFTGQPSPDQLPSNYKQLKEQDEHSIAVENLTVPKSADTDSRHHPFKLNQSVLLPNKLEPTLNKRDDVSLSTDGSPDVEFSSKIPTLDVPLRKISAEVDTETECGRHLKVVEHIRRFNSLSLNDHTPKYKTVLSPLKFKRTPVRQSIKRMNSLLYGSNKSIANRTRSCKLAIGSPMVKSVSQESALSFNPKTCLKHDIESVASTQNVSTKQSKHRNDVQQNNLPVEGFCKTKPATHVEHSAAFKRETLVSQQKNSFDQNINQSVFEDLTNGKMSRIHSVNCVLPKHSVIVEKMSCVTPEKSFCTSMLHKVSEKEKNRYKGSPKCPISSAKLTTKAIDL